MWCSPDFLGNMKKATTIEEQLARLSERGMTIGNRDTAANLLLDLGYYRLGFYWFPLEKSYPRKDNRLHYFKEGANFDKAVRLYRFDKELRHLLSEYLEDIEVNLRTKVIYIISNTYKENPFWFADEEIVMSSFIVSFDKKYKEEISNNDVIARHAKRHPDHLYAPAWKTLEYISFGDLLRLIDSLKSTELKKQIYACYGFSDDITFPNYMDVIRQMRNNCAHGHPIFDLKLYKSLRAGKFRKVLSGDQGELFSTLSGVLLIIQYILFYLPENKGLQFAKDIKHLLNTHYREDIMDIIGYLHSIPWLNEKL